MSCWDPCSSFGVSTHNRYGVLLDEADLVNDDIGQVKSDACRMRRKRSNRPCKRVRNECKRREEQKSGCKENDSVESKEICMAESTERQLRSSRALVQIVELKPGSLLHVLTTIGGQEVKALVDSGASRSLVRKSVVDVLKLSPDVGKSFTLQGLGMKCVDTLGEVRLSLSLYGLEVASVKVQVVEDGVIDQTLILGVDFLVNNKISVNVKNRKLTKFLDNGGHVDIYLNEHAYAVNIIHEAIPVYAAQSCYISKGESTRVPVNFELYGDTSCGTETMFYDGHFKHKLLRGIDGIFERGCFSHFVSIDNVGGQVGSVVGVKRGDCLGRVSTVIEMDDSREREEEEEATWSVEEICKEVKLGKDLHEDERTQVINMLVRTQNALSKDDNDIGLANVTPHCIELSNNTPIWQKPRRFPDPVAKEIERQCVELLSQDIIELSNSPWSSPVVPIRKPDGTLRLCVDYRKVNSVTKAEKFPMPHLLDSVYCAHNVRYFTKLDLTKGYYQIPIDKESRQYTAFSTTHNQYQFKRLSFGLKNSGIQFQRNMQEILSEFCFKDVVIYIDDILIMGRTFQEHIMLVEKVLACLMLNGIKIKVSKCEFFMEQVSFLGHLLSRSGIKKAPEFVEKIRNFPKPHTVTQLRQFLGLVNFQRKFVARCSELAKPLTAVTGGLKHKRLVWTEEMDHAFVTLKEKLVEDSMLAFPDYSEGAHELELYVDASGTGAGACLLQYQQGEYRTIGYSSTTFSEAETRYSTIERELVAVRWGIKSFRAFLFGVRFSLFTDHKPLLYLHNMSKENSRLMRTLNEIAEYDFSIRYRPGCNNEAADAMSRIVGERSGGVVRKCGECELPEGLTLLSRVEGGGDSLFVSLYLLLEQLSQEKQDVVVPGSHGELRVQLVEYLLDNAGKFGMKLDKFKRRQVKLMKNLGELPCVEVLYSACELYHLEIYVHYGMISPVVFRCGDSAEAHIIHLQCVSGIHYNPVIRQGSDVLAVCNAIPLKNVNDASCLRDQTRENGVSEIRCGDNDVLSTLRILVALQRNDCQCGHSSDGNRYIAGVASCKFCCIVDTGAQVSVISEDTWNRLKLVDDSLELRQCSDGVLQGIGGNSTGIVGIADLQLSLLDSELQFAVPFAVVRADAMPCCCILGINFLFINDVTLDYFRGVLSCVDAGGERLLYPIQKFPEGRLMQMKFFLGNIHCYIAEDGLSEESDVEADENAVCLVKYTLSNEDVVAVQNSDQVLRDLKSKVVENVSTKLWEQECLFPFKRYRPGLRVTFDLLIRDTSRYSSVVIPFGLLVDIVFKVHCQLGHVGRHKLVDVVMRNFWHPSLDRVARDICMSCSHCQLYKVSAQVVVPPILRIQTSAPFELVAIDVMMFPKSKRGNVAVVVCVDHFSKWLVAVPVRDKRARTVTRVFEEQVLPSFAGIPARVLSDNGAEFRAEEFNRLLDSYNISHVYSTPYRAASNGCVERCNRTVIQLLKGLIKDEPLLWDALLPRVLSVYNNTIHSQTGMSPSQCLLESSHSPDRILHINKDIVSSWKQGHSKFVPFNVGERVLRKIQRIGNRVSDKFAKKFDGPFVVLRVHSNDVTYDLQKCFGDGSVVKAHFRQLKPWREVPDYLRQYITSDGSVGDSDGSVGDSDGSVGDSDGFVGDSDGSVGDSDASAAEDLDVSAGDSDWVLESSNCSSTSEDGSDSSNSDILELHASSKNVDDMPLTNSGGIQGVESSSGKASPGLVEDISIGDGVGGLLSRSVGGESVALDHEGDASFWEIHRRISSPIFSMSSGVFSLGVNECLSEIRKTSEACIARYEEWKANLSEGSALEWMHSSLVFQKTLVDLVDAFISDSRSSTGELNSRLDLSVPDGRCGLVAVDVADQTPAEAHVSVGDKIAFVPDGEIHYVGCGEDKSVPEGGSARLVASRLFERSLQVSVDTPRDYRESNNNFLRQIWHRRYMCSESRLVSSFQSDVSQGVPFPALNLGENIVTRSRGSVVDYPNVQEKPIEYKTRHK